MDMDYYKIPRISNSGMTALAKSPAHYQTYLKTEFDTPAMRFGRLVHTAILEPHLLNIAGFDGDRRTKEGKAAYLALAESGKEPVSVEEYDSIMRMRDAVLATGLIVGDFEVPLLWTDEETGALCKGRADIVSGDMIWDVKTTHDASDFAYSVRKYDYDRQAAFYLDAVKASGHPKPIGFGWIVVEKTPPYGVKVFTASQITIETGRSKYRPLCALYAQCCFNGEWPNYSTTKHEEI
jgi:hypothetical protein